MPTYQYIIRFLKSRNYTVISEHVAAEGLEKEGINSRSLLQRISYAYRINGHGEIAQTNIHDVLD